MNYKQLFSLLENYGTISEAEQKNIEKYFKPLETKKKQTLIDRQKPANKLFFVNEGFLRAYYINENGKEITRMIAWENRFLTNLSSFRSLNENNEVIESITNAEILQINRTDFEILLKSSSNLKSMYADILEEYNAVHIRRFESLNTFDIEKKFQHLKDEYPHLIKNLNDKLLASFLGISRIHYFNNKHLL